MTDHDTRRYDILRLTPEEAVIRSAIIMVEQMPADVRLTDAVISLMRAQRLVADYVDGAAPAPPAEPAQPDDGWIEWKGGECPVDPKTIVETRYRNGDGDDPRPAHRFGWDHWGGEKGAWDIIAYRIVKPASAPVAEGDPDDGMVALAAVNKLIAALEAENAALREIVGELDDALGEDDDEYPDETPMTIKCGRSTYHSLKLGLFRRARALLQGDSDAG